MKHLRLLFFLAFFPAMATYTQLPSATCSASSPCQNQTACRTIEAEPLMPPTVLYAEICEGDIYLVAGNSYTQMGTYWISLVIL